jgi:hypothetical protein
MLAFSSKARMRSRSAETPFFLKPPFDCIASAELPGVVVVGSTTACLRAPQRFLTGTVAFATLSLIMSGYLISGQYSSAVRKLEESIYVLRRTISI